MRSPGCKARRLVFSALIAPILVGVDSSSCTIDVPVMPLCRQRVCEADRPRVLLITTKRHARLFPRRSIGRMASRVFGTIVGAPAHAWRAIRGKGLAGQNGASATICAIAAVSFFA